MSTTALVMATLGFCLTVNGKADPSKCEHKQIMAERRICSLGEVKAKLPVNGKWEEGVAFVKC